MNSEKATRARLFFDRFKSVCKMNVDIFLFDQYVESMQ